MPSEELLSARDTVDPAAPTGRAARLWKVLVELSRSIDEALAQGDRAAGARGTASPATGAKTRPMLPARIENLVVEFDDAYTIFVEGMDRLPSAAQLMALQAVDRQLAAMIRAQDAALWTEKALREDVRWSETRRLVLCVIEAFEWPARRLTLVASETSRREP